MTAVLHSLANLHEWLIEVAEECLQLCLQFTVEVGPLVFLRHEGVEPTTLTGIRCSMIFLQFCQFGGLLHGIVEASKLIHEFNL